MTTETKVAKHTSGPNIDPELRKTVAEKLGPEVEQKIHADALRMSTHGWEIEAGPITESRLSPYMSVSYSIRYAGGTFRLVQRVSDDNAGYAEAFNRARLIAAAPEMLAALETLLACEALEMYRRDDNPDWDAPEVATARAAIRKAQGEL